MTQVPTQSRHPWRATLRTIAAASLGLLLVLPEIVKVLGLTAVPWVAAALAVTGAVTRVLAIPGVNAWLRRFAPFLSADGKPGSAPGQER